MAPLEPLHKLEAASADMSLGSEARATVLGVIAGHGMVAREKAGLAQIPADKRKLLRKMGVHIGALDVFAPLLLKPAPRRLLSAIGVDRRPLRDDMASVIEGFRHLPAGYRHAGSQAIRVDVAEKLFRAAHEGRAAAGSARYGKRFLLDLALGTSMGLAEANQLRLLRDAGFRPVTRPTLPQGAFGPPEPALWEWRAPRKDKPAQNARKGDRPAPPREGNAFAALAGLLD